MLSWPPPSSASCWSSASLIINESVQESWTGQATTHVPSWTNVSAELVKVSLFLASFSGLYFTVSAITDETYRGQFFAAVMAHLETGGRGACGLPGAARARGRTRTT